MSPDQMLSIVKGGAEIARLFNSSAARPANNRLWRQLDNMLGLLRSIYFAPSGTRLLLEEIASGNPVDGDLIPETLTRFNDFEHYGMREMDSLAFEATEGLELSLSARETLHRLRHGKGGVRRHIQEALNYTLTFDREEIAPETARQLLTEIDALNAEIRSAEESIINRMRSELR